MSPPVFGARSNERIRQLLMKQWTTSKSLGDNCQTENGNNGRYQTEPSTKDVGEEGRGCGLMFGKVTIGHEKGTDHKVDVNAIGGEDEDILYGTAEGVHKGGKGREDGQLGEGKEVETRMGDHRHKHHVGLQQEKTRKRLRRYSEIPFPSYLKTVDKGKVKWAFSGLARVVRKEAIVIAGNVETFKELMEERRGGKGSCWGWSVGY